MFNTPPSPNIPKGSELGSICTQTKLFITKGMVFNDNFAINSVYFFLNQGTCEIIFADRDKQSVCVQPRCFGEGAAPSTCISANTANVTVNLWSHRPSPSCG